MCVNPMWFPTNKCTIYILECSLGDFRFFHSYDRPIYPPTRTPWTRMRSHASLNVPYFEKIAFSLLVGEVCITRCVLWRNERKVMHLVSVWMIYRRLCWKIKQTFNKCGTDLFSLQLNNWTIYSTTEFLLTAMQHVYSVARSLTMWSWITRHIIPTLETCFHSGSERCWQFWRDVSFACYIPSSNMECIMNARNERGTCADVPFIGECCMWAESIFRIISSLVLSLFSFHLKAKQNNAARI